MNAEMEAKFIAVARTRMEAEIKEVKKRQLIATLRAQIKMRTTDAVGFHDEDTFAPPGVVEFPLGTFDTEHVDALERYFFHQDKDALTNELIAKFLANPDCCFFLGETWGF